MISTCCNEYIKEIFFFIIISMKSIVIIKLLASQLNYLRIIFINFRRGSARLTVDLVDVLHALP